MPYVRNWIHAVWGTKNRQHLLTKGPREKLFFHIKENARKKGIYVDCINGVTDHVHCLFSLPADMALSQALQLMKGEASYRANKEKLFSHKLYWAEEYFGASVSESVLGEVRVYIFNQEEHHRKKTFDEEFQHFIDSLGLESTESKQG